MQGGITNYPIHLKIDTGMHRLGFTEEDVPELMSRIQNQTGVRIQSVFSHLAASESWNFDEFTLEQIKTFKKIAKVIEQNCHYPIMKHILNSAGIERFPPEEQMDMVRLGDKPLRGQRQRSRRIEECLHSKNNRSANKAYKSRRNGRLWA